MRGRGAAPSHVPPEGNGPAAVHTGTHPLRHLCLLCIPVTVHLVQFVLQSLSSASRIFPSLGCHIAFQNLLSVLFALLTPPFKQHLQPARQKANMMSGLIKGT